MQGLIAFFSCPGAADLSPYLSFALALQPLHIPHPSSSSIPGGGFGGMGGGGVGGECIGGGGVSPMGGVGVGGLGGASGRGRPLNLKMKFVCGQCWREGQVSEPDKNLKYCTAKARHRSALFVCFWGFWGFFFCSLYVYVSSLSLQLDEGTPGPAGKIV